MENLSDRIRRLRRAKHISQAALAARLGIKPASVAEWELGESRPRMDRMEKLAQELGVSLAYLMTGERNPTDERREELVSLLPKLEGDSVDALLQLAKRLARAA